MVFALTSALTTVNLCNGLFTLWNNIKAIFRETTNQVKETFNNITNMQVPKVVSVNLDELRLKTIEDKLIKVEDMIIEDRFNALEKWIIKINENISILLAFCSQIFTQLFLTIVTSGIILITYTVLLVILAKRYKLLILSVLLLLLKSSFIIIKLR